MYVSAQSVVLALLAAHAQRVGDGSGTVPTEIDPNAHFRGEDSGQATAVARPLAEKIIPFYTNCLLEVQFPV